MREILFRGKRVDNSEWEEGDFISSVAYPDRAWITESKTLFDRKICEIAVREVDSSTVGQYTGMTDKTGAKIFEGDVVRFTYCNTCFSLKNNISNIDLLSEPIVAVKFYGEYEQTGVVSYRNAEFIVTYISDESLLYNRLNEIDTISKIIGNIHDNPELLGEKQYEGK